MSRRVDLLGLLDAYQPTAIFLQECRNTAGAYATLRADVRPFGHNIIPCSRSGLVAVVLDGFNIAPLGALESDDPFRLQRLLTMSLRGIARNLIFYSKKRATFSNVRVLLDETKKYVFLLSFLTFYHQSFY